MAKKVSKKRIKRSKEWLERSARAKRGWVTRRERATLILGIAKLDAAIKTVKEEQKKSKRKPSVEIPKKKRGKKRKIDELKDILNIRGHELVDMQLDFIKEKKKRDKELIKDLVAWQEKLIAMTDMERLTRNWDDLLPDYKLRRDRSIAAQPSRARHRPDTPMILDYLWGMNKKGRLDEGCQEIARLTDLPIREIYTLWYSP